MMTNLQSLVPYDEEYEEEEEEKEEEGKQDQANTTTTATATTSTTELVVNKTPEGEDPAFNSLQQHLQPIRSLLHLVPPPSITSLSPQSFSDQIASLLHRRSSLPDVDLLSTLLNQPHYHNPAILNKITALFNIDQHSSWRNRNIQEQQDSIEAMKQQADQQQQEQQQQHNRRTTTITTTTTTTGDKDNNSHHHNNRQLSTTTMITSTTAAAGSGTSPVSVPRVSRWDVTDSTDVGRKRREALQKIEELGKRFRL